MSQRITRTEVAPQAGPGFQKGHEKWGGRKKRTAAQARAMADQLGVDPLFYLCNLLAVDVVTEVEIGPDGKERKVKVPVTHETKISVAQSLANYFYPRLNATQVTGADDGPVRTATVTLDVSAILAKPELAYAAQELALAVVQQEADAEGPAEYPAYHPLRLNQSGE